MMIFFMAMPSCKDDRDVQDSLNGENGKGTAAVQGPLRTATMFADLDFSMDAPELDVQKEDDLRALKFKFEGTLNDLAKKRKMTYAYDDGEEVDALLMLRCNGLTVDASATDNTPTDMPYLYAFIKLQYHTESGCTHTYPKLSKKAGQPIDGGHFIVLANEINFSWHGKPFEEIMSNTQGREWQVRLFLNNRLGDMMPDNAGNAPKSYEVKAGDETHDRHEALDVDTDNDHDQLRKRQTPVDLYDLYVQESTSAVAQNLDKLAKDSDVPFMSAWRTVEFFRINHEGKKLSPTEIANDTNKPYYAFDVAKKANGKDGAHIRLRPQGCFVLVDMSTANTTPFTMKGRGINVTTSAFSFAGKYDFSEATLKANGGEPKWIPSNTFLRKGEKKPTDPNVVYVPTYEKNFQFADVNNPGTRKEVEFKKNTEDGDQFYCLFWVMPNDIPGATEADYQTSLYLTSHFGAGIITGNDLPTSSEEKKMYIQTNYNIRRVIDGQVAAIMPARPFVDDNGGSHNFTAEDILQGKGGKADQFIRHGVVGNRRVWLQLPSIKNFPLYASQGKCAFKAKVDAQGNPLPFVEKKFTDEGEDISYGREGDLKHGRILYAQVQNLNRPIMFLEYMSETPCVNTDQIDAQRDNGAHPVEGEHGNYWAENSGKFPYNGGQHYELMASRMNVHWNLLGDQMKSDFQPIPWNTPKANFIRSDEFHFDFFDAEGLARNNVYGYIQTLPKSQAMGTYFRQYMETGTEGYVADQEVLPSPLVHNAGTQTWYRLRFYGSGNKHYVIEDVGDNQQAMAKPQDNSNDAQLWGFVKKNNEIKIINKKTRNYLDYWGGKVKSVTYLDRNEKYGIRNIAAWEVKRRDERLNLFVLRNKRMANNKALNPSGGFRYPGDKPLEDYNLTDRNNLLEFVKEDGTVQTKSSPKFGNGGMGPYNINQNFASRPGYDNVDKVRPTYVYRGTPKNGGGLIYYAVRYMDHADGKTCTKDNIRPSNLHEDGDWKKCNNRRCVVRYERGRYFDRVETYRKKKDNDWIKENKEKISESSLYSVTARYVGKADGMAQRTMPTPVWATEKFWQYNNIDDVVRYYTSYGYMYQGGYNGVGVFSFYWSGQPSLPGAQTKCNAVLNLDCARVNLGYGGGDAGHAYACVDRQNRARQDRIGFYLFMDIKDWTMVPNAFKGKEEL